MSNDVHEELAQLNSLISSLHAQGRYEEAIRYAIEARDLALYRLGDENLDYATTLNDLAVLYQLTGSYAKAEPLLQKALQIRIRALGEEHPHVADSLNNLGALYFSMGKYGAVEPLYNRALEIIRKSFGEDDPEYATGLHNLGALYNAIGNYTAAEQILRQTLEIRQRALGEQDRSVAESLDNLAQVYAKVGNYASAEDLYRRALEIYRISVGEVHPAVAITLHNFAALYTKMGKLAAAEPLYRQALDVYRATLGENHSYFLKARDDLAALHSLLTGGFPSEDVERELLQLHKKASQLREQSRFEEAIPLAEKQIDILRQAGGGEENPEYAISLSNLGDLYRLAGNYAKAEPLLQQALEIYSRTLSQDHPYFAASLDSLASLYHQTGDYARAEPLYRQVLESKKRTLGNEHPEVAGTLHNLALLYAEKADYVTAVTLMRQSLDIFGLTLGEEHPFFIATRDALGELALSQIFVPQPRTASDAIQAQIAQISEQSDQLRQRGQFMEAIPVVEQQQDLIRQLEGGEENLEFAITLGNLADLYHSIGDYAAAEPLSRRALDILRRTVGENDPEYARELNNRGALLRSMGDYPAALEVSQQALELARATRGEEHPGVATAMNNLAGLQMAMGNYATAEPLYQKALRIRRRRLGEADAEVAELLDNLGGLYFAIGDYAAAEEQAQQALNIYRRALGDKHPDVATTLSNLAGIYSTIRQHDTALALLEEALEIRRAAFGEQHPAVVQALHNLAGLYRAMGKFTESEDLYLKTLDMQRAAFGSDHPHVADSLFNVAEFYREMGNFTAAERFMREAVQIYESKADQNHRNQEWTFFILALLCARRDSNDEALTYLQQASKIEDRTIGQIFSIGSERQRLNYLMLARTTFSFFMSIVVEALHSKPAAIQAALGFTLRRKALTLEAHAIQRDAVFLGRYPSLAPKLKELATLRLQIAQKTLAGFGIYDSNAHDQLLANWRIRQELLETELAQQIPEMKLETQLDPTNRKAIASHLPTGTLLVEFVLFDVYNFKAVPARGEPQWKQAHYLAFVLSAGEPDNVQMIDLGEAEPIDKLIALFRAAAARGDRALTIEPEETRQEQSQELKNGTDLRIAVFDPLLNALGDHTRLFLAPDGDLSQLPFEALPLDDGRRLIDLYEISYLSTGRDVLRFPNEGNRALEPSAVLADPDFDLDAEGPQAPTSEEQHLGPQSRDLDRSGLRFNRLKGAREEGEQVAAQLGVQPLLAETALEVTLKSLHSPRILHLATHGFFLPDQPRDPNAEGSSLATASDFGGGRLLGQRLENPLLRSGLALAGANSWLQGKTLRPEAEDGLLTAEDVTGLDLLDTELVVLSACDTGRGEVHVGEGVFGLRRAFVLAGAKTLVMSLWKVPDRATRELMVDFYQQLLKGTPRAEALRQAQLALKKKYPNPHFWGAFICQGDPGPLLQVGSKA